MPQSMKIYLQKKNNSFIIQQNKEGIRVGSLTVYWRLEACLEVNN